MIPKPSRAAATLGGIMFAAQCFGSPQDFQFNKLDLRLLDDVNILDRHLDDNGFVYADRETNSYIQAFAARLLGGKPVPERVQYHVRVLRDATVEAFGFPNGSIYISTGMLSALETEGQMVLILAREIAHVADRHQYLTNRVARNRATLGYAAAAADPLFGYFIIQSLAGRWVYGNGYSRGMENEADRDGLDMTTAAGYDAQSAVHAFELLEERLEPELPDTPYRSHENLEKRIGSMRVLIASTPSSGRGAATDSDYLAHVANAVCYNIGADLESRRVRTALARAERLVNWKPDRPEYTVLLADAYRGLGAKTSAPTKEELSFGGGYDRRQLLRLTPEEEQAKLLAKRGGPDVMKANEAAAEKLYLDAIARQPSLPAAHRGLGMLYQMESRNEDAAREFRRYLELAPADAVDRLRVQRRLAQLDKIREQPSEKR